MEVSKELMFNGKPLISQKRLKPLKIIIYGENGVGKTSFAAEALCPIIMDMEGNAEHIEGAARPDTRISTLDEAKAFLNLVINSEHGFKTLVVDSLDQLENLISREITRLNQSVAYAEAKKTWNAHINKFEELFEQVHKKKGMNIIFTAHVKIAPVNDTMTDLHDKYDLRVNAHMKTAFANWVQCILFAKQDVVLTGKTGSFNSKKAMDMRRISLYTEGNPTYFGKNVFNLPSKILYEKGKGWSELTKHIKQFYSSNNNNEE